METNKKIIDESINWYSTNKKLFEKLAKKIESIIEELLKDEGVSIHAIASRAKEVSSFGEKIQDSKYTNPITQITDLAGVRIITYVESDLERVSKIIKEAFDIDYKNSIDKSETLGADKVGYRSIHYIATLKSDRLKLPEYKKFKGLNFEIQIRTILQHAWAEIEHDKDYKFSGELPMHLKRRFKVLAGVLELADREFNGIATEIDDYSTLVKSDTKKGELNIEINSTSIKSYLDYKFSDLTNKNILIRDKTVPREAIQELKSMGFEKLEELDSQIPSDLNKKIIQFVSDQENYIGLLRTILMVIDVDKYFSQAWKNKWQGIDHNTVSVLKAYNVDIGIYLKKHKMQILGQSNIR
jgi:putative GTP pyrophosphokinase